MARRFIVDQKDLENIDENTFKIFGSEVKHIQVLRHDIGDEIKINEYVCDIKEIRKDNIILEKKSNVVSIGEPNVNITLYMAVLKNDKMDFVVQKAVELGVKNIVPFFSKNVVVKLDDKSRIKRQEKLQVIANEACKQCGRTDTVNVFKFIEFNDLINKMPEHETNFFAYEAETNSLRESINKCVKNKNTNISLIIGAEGGFDTKEAEKLKKIQNVFCVSLGSRILRAETASLNLLSIIMYEIDI